ncbi:MAG: transposase [Desulfobulbaceae bacterium DB1]|nr:MAG: transposase [Desulfobulbaceae bacterium DB1]OKY74414.1 MAG: transposase [Desulfobulbaceae bacterium DB1]
MKRFILEQSDDEFYTSHSGLALVGLCINRYSGLPLQISKKMKGNDVISHTDIVRSFLGLLCLGKSDYEAISAMRDDTYFQQSLGIKNVPSAERLRQRLDEHAEPLLPIIKDCSVAMLKKGGVHFTALDTGHVPLDADVFPMDNSNTKKEGVSRTYHNYNGYAPIASYLGLEGWCLEVELRPGSQHSQEGFVPYLNRVIERAKTLTSKKLLVRLDSAHDALETRLALRDHNKVSYIIKWNPRRENTNDLCARAFAEGAVTEPRAGKRVALLTIRKNQEHEGQHYGFTKVVRVTERITNKHGQLLIVPDMTVEGWWTNLDLPAQKIISLYENHGLSEQFHSEFKSDLDLERLPSGKFRTNELIMALGAFAYNILRLIGQLGLLGEHSPVRHPAKRRRIKTVIQELIYRAARLISSGNRLRLRFSCHCPAFAAFADVYNRLLPTI